MASWQHDQDESRRVGGAGQGKNGWADRVPGFVRVEMFYAVQFAAQELLGHFARQISTRPAAPVGIDGRMPPGILNAVRSDDHKFGVTGIVSDQKHQMTRDRFFRAVLIVGAFFNCFMAAVILFPDSIGRFTDLPRSGSRFYSWLLALFVALFGGVYAYLSRVPVIDRSLIFLAAIGKTGVFLVALACLLLGDLSPRAFAPAVGDLIFAFFFLWWLRSTSFK